MLYLFEFFVAAGLMFFWGTTTDRYRSEIARMNANFQILEASFFRLQRANRRAKIEAAGAIALSRGGNSHQRRIARRRLERAQKLDWV